MGAPSPSALEYVHGQLLALNAFSHQALRAKGIMIIGASMTHAGSNDFASLHVMVRACSTFWCMQSKIETLKGYSCLMPCKSDID